MQDAIRTHRYSSPEALAEHPADIRLFAGREDELVQVFRQLQTSNSVVIYGQPGVGRTSLLRAGVSPLLRERGFLPIHFSWRSGTAELPFTGIAEGLKAAPEAAIRRAAEKAVKSGKWTLTSLFKTAALPLTNAKSPVVIIIDDFEEIFALYPVAERAKLMQELAELLLKRYPTNGDANARSPWKGAPTLKLLVSVNQNQIAFLDEFREILPEFLTRRLRLAAPNFQQAVQILRQGAEADLPEAVCEPFALDDEIALPILAHSRLRNPGPLDAGKDLYDLFLLRLLASHVENLMVEAQKPTPPPDPAATPTTATAEGGETPAEEDDEVGLAFDPQSLPKLLPQLLLAYYQERVAAVPANRRAAVQNLMEASLYGAISQEHGIPRRLLETQYGLEPAVIDQLAESRLLREVVSNQAFSYCLWHDSLREGIRLIRRARSRESLRRKGYALVALAACAAISFHLMPKEKLAGTAGSTDGKPSLREQYADQPERLEALLQLESQNHPDNPRPLWELASLQEEQGRNVEALKTIDRLEQMTQPASPGLLRRKALVLERLGQEADAAAVKEQLLAALEQSRSEMDVTPDAESEIARLHGALGDIRAREGRVEEARTHYITAIKVIQGTSGEGSRKELARLHTEVGDLHFRMERTQSAATEYEKALALAPDFQPALEGRAQLKLKAGRGKEAAEDLAKIAAQAPDNLLVRFEQAQALQAAGQHAEALAALESLIAKYPHNASLALRKGQVLLAQGQRGAALDAFNRTLELEGENADALMARAQILSETDQIERAIEDYTRVIELQPAQARAYGNRGILYRKLTQLDKALADYNKVLELDPDDAHIHYLRGNLFLDSNRLEEALADFGKAAQLEPKNARAFNNRGFVLSLLGRFKEAIEDFGKAIELDPVYAEAYSNRGFAIYSDSQSTQALADFHRAIILAPNDAHNYINRGRYYLEIDEYESALKDFDKSVELDAENAEAYQFRSQVLTKLGQTERANADTAKAQALDGGGS